ncbi:MAG: 4-hydroxy-2-oxoheptanedioate aldolase [Synergistales bacterium]|jgi:4-hydroxy-2-oxoheptanedioate aldolase|nr:4-hydroxy-2-oxoheptanedioate aldolase [Synergistales bacterium]MDN5336301.1 4-hydroxy-2-oxoheptanedioate aldolase [Synergistales bacterium]
MTNRMKEKLGRREVVVGPFVGLNCPDLVEIMGITGFDFCVIDTEHGPMNPESIQHMIRTAELSGMTPVVRVTEAKPTDILRVLDVGAKAVHVPQVNDAETAEMVAKAARYHPRGMRGVAVPRALSYGLRPLGETLEEANRDTMVIVHCENAAGLEKLGEIACVEGVDMVFVGPYDLSQSLGVPGQIMHPDMKEAVGKALSIIDKAGKPAGIFVTSVDEAIQRIEEGFRYIAYSMDSLIFGLACRDQLDRIKKTL